MKSFVGIILVVFLLGVCTTRIPEAPDSNSAEFPDADRVEILISNLRKSIQTLNNKAYLDCFSDSSFVYRADPQDSLDYPFKLTDWSYDKEALFINNFFPLFPENSPLPQTDFVPSTIVDEEDSLFENILFMIPDLAATAHDSSLPAGIRVTVDLVIKKGIDNLYYIHRWIEEATSDSVLAGYGSWATVKAGLVQ